MNQFNAVGRLTRDFEVEKLPSGGTVSKSAIAVNRDFKNKEGKYDADFFNIEVWGEGFANNAVKIFHKGDLISLVGSVRIDNFKTKEGQNRSATKVVASKVRILASKNSSNNGNEYEGNRNEYQQSNSSNGFNAGNFDPSGFSPVEDDDDVPF